MSTETTRQIIADYDAAGIYIYQAFKPEIADAALQHGKFGKGFSLDRMTWIKPSFGWMLYRSDYATAHRQERILKVKLTHEGFLTILANSIPTSHEPDLFSDANQWRKALAHSEARYQWDPDRDLWRHKLERRALQVGISGSLVENYVEKWTLEIQDLTELAHAVHKAVKEGQESIPLSFEEKIYAVPPEIARTLSMSFSNPSES